MTTEIQQLNWIDTTSRIVADWCDRNLVAADFHHRAMEAVVQCAACGNRKGFVCRFTLGCNDPVGRYIKTLVRNGPACELRTTEK